jgi:hypothetical protein
MLAIATILQIALSVFNAGAKVQAAQSQSGSAIASSSAGSIVTPSKDDPIKDKTA